MSLKQPGENYEDFCLWFPEFCASDSYVFELEDELTLKGRAVDKQQESNGIGPSESILVVGKEGQPKRDKKKPTCFLD